MSIKGQKTTTTYMEWNDFISLITRLEKDGDYKFCLLISIGVFTGLRISDLLTLKYTDLLNNDTFSINEMKTKKQRSIKVNKDLKEIVNRIVSKSNITNLNQLIFINRYETKSIDKSYVNVKLKEIIKKYRIKIIETAKYNQNTTFHLLVSFFIFLKICYFSQFVLLILI